MKLTPDEELMLEYASIAISNLYEPVPSLKTQSAARRHVEAIQRILLNKQERSEPIQDN